MEHSRTLIVLAVMLAAAAVATGSDVPVTIEVTGASMEPSVPSDADWGWWTPAKYSLSWDPDEDASFDFTELRMLADYGQYTVVLAGEWYPDLLATGSYPPTGGGDPVVEELVLESTIYDLGFGMNFGKGRRQNLFTWVGATYMDLRESLTTVPAAGSGDSEVTDRADSRIWGVVLGLEGTYQIRGNWGLAGRLVYRWASGDREATINSQDPAGGEAEVKDEIDHSMWGADLGIRWTSSKQVWIEAGWRYRDRTLGDGPARFGGPQLRLGLEF